MGTRDDNEERRQTPRKVIAYFTRVFNADSNELIGNLGDVTSTGAMVICREPHPIDTAFRLRVELSEDVADKPFMEFEALSIWCEPDLDPALFTVGFSITLIEADDLAIIKKIQAVYALREEP